MRATRWAGFLRFRRLARLATAFLAASGTMVALAFPPPAQALRGLTIGFSADPVLTNPPLIGIRLSTQRLWIRRAAAQGAGIVRVNVQWASVAPRRPPAHFVAQDPASRGYHWKKLDDDVRFLVADHIAPMLMLYLAPRWAEGSDRPRSFNAGSWRPDPTAFAEFAQAVATRYSGRYPDRRHRGRFLPRVRYWQAWNEPNLAAYLAPQWTSSDQPESPSVYRPLLNGFYSAVKAVDPTNMVLMAGTAPYGDPPDVFAPGGQRMKPLLFYRKLFCVNEALRSVSCPAGPVHLDAIDHHPYEIKPPQVPAYFPDDISVPDVWQIRRVLDAGVRAGHVLPAGHKSIWVGEITWDSNPPSKNPIAAPIADQACYVQLAMYLLWRQGVDTVLWEQIRDSAPERGWPGAFMWGGMYYHSGKPKPAATAFRFPLVVRRINASYVEVWGRAPRGGVLRLRRQLPSGQWVVVARRRVLTHQVFQITLPLSGPIRVRGSVGSAASLTWTQPGASCPTH